MRHSVAPRTHPRPFFPALAFLLLLPACGAEAPSAASDGPVVRDSAGIRIVENSRPAWAEGEGWTVAAEPDLVLEQLAGVPIYGVGSLDVDRDGRILVAHAGEQQLVVLDSEGAVVRTIGRRGEGPGEFSMLGWAHWVFGDSILAVEFTQQTVLADDGTGVRIARPSRALLDATSPMFMGALGEDEFLANGWVEDGISAEGIADTRLVATSRDFDQPRSIARVPATQCTSIVDSEGCAIDTFGPVGLPDFEGEELVHVWGAEYQVVRFDPAGRVRRIDRLDRGRVPVTDAMIEQLREEWIARGRAPDRLDQDFERRGGAPDSLTLFSDVVVDELGGVWVRERRSLLRPPFGSGPLPHPTASWGVFGADGEFLGNIELPIQLEVHEIGADWILGVHRDELDVETIRRYPLDRGGG